LKSNTNFQRKLYTFLVVAATVAGTYVGVVTIYKNEVVVNGVLGGATLILIHLLFFPPKAFLINKTVELPRDLKFIPVSFSLSMIVVWSFGHLSRLIIYYINLIK
jgi:hypothetical protein